MAVAQRRQLGDALQAAADKADKKPAALPSGVPSTPQEAADAALAAIDPTTAVTTTGAARSPGGTRTSWCSRRGTPPRWSARCGCAIDAKEHIPLRVDVYSKGANDPAFRVAFTQISFAVPDDQQFRFNPPPDAKVTTEQPSATGPPGDHRQAEGGDRKKRAELARKQGDAPTVVGSGWTSIVVAKAPSRGGAKAPSGGTGPRRRRSPEF
jgi:hypothetical protein